MPQRRQPRPAATHQDPSCRRAASGAAAGGCISQARRASPATRMRHSSKSDFEGTKKSNLVRYKKNRQRVRL